MLKGKAITNFSDIPLCEIPLRKDVVLTMARSLTNRTLKRCPSRDVNEDILKPRLFIPSFNPWVLYLTQKEREKGKKGKGERERKRGK